MHLPFGFSQSSIVWQTVHQKPLFGGMGENAQVLWPEGYTTRLRSKAIKALIIASRNSREPLPHLTDAERALLVEDGTRWSTQSPRASSSRRPPTAAAASA